MHRRGIYRPFALALIMITALVGPSAANQYGVDPVEASRQLLERAVKPQRDGSHLAQLFALRQLRDPDLRELFEHLLTNGDWQVQVHALMGLAELDPAVQLDPARIASAASKAQETIVATGLDLNMISADRMKALLAGPDLQPMAALFLCAELVETGQPIDVTELTTLSKSDDHLIAGLASALLAQLQQPTAWGEFQERLSSLDQRLADNVRVWLLDAVRRYRLTRCIDFPESVLQMPDVDEELAWRAIFTLLHLDVRAGMKAWMARLERNPSYQARVRYGLLLLGLGPGAPASAYDRLLRDPKSGHDADEPIIHAIVALGRALSTKQDPVAAMKVLFDLNHPKSTDWALEQLKSMAPEYAAAVYEHLIDRVATMKDGESISLAVHAAARLFELNPQSVLTRLAQAEDDSEHQQAILLGLFEARDPAIGAAVAALRRVGSGRADSMALILMARHADKLSESDVAQLGTIAAGGGRLSAVLQVQAAWLYLKHTGHAANLARQP